MDKAFCDGQSLFLHRQTYIHFGNFTIKKCVMRDEISPILHYSCYVVDYAGSAVK